jgi:hypothetical protein
MVLGGGAGVPVLVLEPHEAVPHEQGPVRAVGVDDVDVGGGPLAVEGAVGGLEGFAGLDVGAHGAAVYSGGHGVGAFLLAYSGKVAAAGSATAQGGVALSLFVAQKRNIVKGKPYNTIVRNGGIVRVPKLGLSKETLRENANETSVLFLQCNNER